MVRDFCVGIIQQLQEATIPVLWALKSPGSSEALSSGHACSTVDLLKYLTLQALQLSQKLHRDKSPLCRVIDFQTATTEQEWFQLFKSTIRGIGRQLYVVVDMETVNSSLQSVEKFNLMVALAESLGSPDDAETVPTTLKIVVASFAGVTKELADFVVPVKVQRKRRAKARNMHRAISSRILRRGNTSPSSQ